MGEHAVVQMPCAHDEYSTTTFYSTNDSFGWEKCVLFTTTFIQACASEGKPSVYTRAAMVGIYMHSAAS